MHLLAAQFDSVGVIGVVLFYLFGSMAGGSAVYVVVSRDIVRTAVGLLFTLIGVAGLYLLLDAEFLAAVQLVIYVGGTLILIVFGVMLTSKGPFSRFEPKRGEAVLAAAVAVVMLTALVVAIVTDRHAYGATAPMASPQAYPMAILGEALLGDYLVPFEFVSVVLLVVMIGAAYLAKRRRGNTGGNAE